MDLGKTALILPGGGMKCAFQAGSLLAFEEAGIQFVRAQGISGGALNVARYFSSGALDTKQRWLKVEKDGIGSIFGWVKAIKHIFQNALFSDEGINSILDEIDISKLINNPVPIEVVVFNEILETLEVVTNHQFRDCPLNKQAEFRQFIKASASFGGLLTPEDINDQVYSDGRIWALKNFTDCDAIFIIDPGQPQVITNKLDYIKQVWWKRLIRLSTFGFDKWAEKELQEFADHCEFQFFPDPETDAAVWSGIKRIARILAGKPAKKRIVVIHPTINIASLRLDHFAKGDITLSIKHGYEQTKEILEKLSKM